MDPGKGSQVTHKGLVMEVTVYTISNEKFPNKIFEIKKNKYFNTYSLLDRKAMKSLSIPSSSIKTFVDSYQNLGWKVVKNTG
jgi:hypothetical protein